MGGAFPFPTEIQGISKAQPFGRTFGCSGAPVLGEERPGGDFEHGGFFCFLFQGPL